MSFENFALNGTIIKKFLAVLKTWKIWRLRTDIVQKTVVGYP